MAFSALSAGVSGLQSFSDAIGVVADNITNVNTVGYKETSAVFSTLVTENSSASTFSPGGVRSVARTLVSQQGLFQSSQSSTDLSIDGAGFFVVRDAANAGDRTGETLFTRAGSFTEDSEGFFRNTAGLVLLGYPIDRQGNLPINLNDQGALEPININNLNGLTDDTNNVSFRVTLDAEGPALNAGGGFTAYAPGQLSGVGGTSIDSSFPQNNIFATNIQIFDTLGRSHQVTLSAVKTDVNTYSYELTFDDPTSVDATNHPNGLIGLGEFSFDENGFIDLSTTTFRSTVDAAGTPDLTGGVAIDLQAGDPLTFDYAVDLTGDSARAAPGNIAFNFGSGGGADGITLNATNSGDGSGSTLISFSADGAQFDNISDVQISDNGEVTALFRNGLSLTVFQLPLANFSNPDGLVRRPGNAFSISDNSGDPALQLAGTGGAGTVSAFSLELSTVDLAEQFSELIRFQRAFSASTRIITTADEVLDQLTRL